VAVSVAEMDALPGMMQAGIALAAVALVMTYVASRVFRLPVTLAAPTATDALPSDHEMRADVALEVRSHHVDSQPCR